MFNNARSNSAGLCFGIYPGSAVDTDAGSGVIRGRADDPAQIKIAVDRLQPAHRPFILRGYMQNVGSGQGIHATPAEMTQYVTESRKLDLMLCYRTTEGNIDDWMCFIRKTLREFGPSLAKMQITEEPNNPHAEAGGDGSFPKVKRAIVAGILAAKDELKQQGYSVKVGFNATPSIDPTQAFWTGLAQQDNCSLFAESLDYVGSISSRMSFAHYH